MLDILHRTVVDIPELTGEMFFSPFLETASDSTPESWQVNLPPQTTPSSKSRPCDQGLLTLGVP